MTDYTQVTREQQLNIEKQLAINGMHGRYFEDVEAGVICAICLQPKHNCECNGTDGE